MCLCRAGTPLGDPIEMGALGAALASGSGRDSLAVVGLGSSKSCYGHTEGTAGLSGALLAVACLQQHLLPPVINLRSVNPYVGAAISEWQSKHSLAAAPGRQLGAAASQTASLVQIMAGTSSFGMSGVNAHALVSQGHDGRAGPVDCSSCSMIWQRQHFWPSPAAHPALARAYVHHGAMSSSRSAVICEVQLHAASLSWLWEHAVQGRPLLPAAAMYEMGAAAAAACSSSEGRATQSGSVALQSLNIVAPFVLPSTSVGSLLLHCTLDTHSGGLRIESHTCGLHLEAAVSSAAPGRSADSGILPNHANHFIRELSKANTAAGSYVGHNIATVSAANLGAAG